MLSRLLLAVLTSALMGAPAQAASDWWLVAAGPDGETQYSCGDACRQTQLICAHWVMAESEPVRIEDIADEAVVPWGQIDFVVLGRIMRDREGLAGGSKVADGERLDRPVPVSFGNADWVLARYQMLAKGGRLEAEFLLWPAVEGLALLRCSYNAGVDDEGAKLAVRQLAESLRLTP